MAKVLVIGGNQFIGRALVERLLERGDDVAIMHRRAGTPYGKRVREVICDRNDVNAVRRTLSDEQFDFVFDNVYDWQRGTSSEQVRAAAESVRGVHRYVFTSSIAVYPHGGPYDEDAQLLPADASNLYGAQKAESERALFRLCRAEGVAVSTVRPSFIYGPHNPFPRESFFWDRIMAGRPIIVPDDGSATMQWVHVADVADAAILAATNDRAVGRAYNLGNYPPISQRDFVELLARVAGRTVHLVPIPRSRIQAAGGQLTEPPLYFGAYLDLPPITVRVNRVREELGLELRSLEDGMRETFEWYRAQPRENTDFTWEDRLLGATR